jgi:hypothetical protein
LLALDQVTDDPLQTLLNALTPNTMHIPLTILSKAKVWAKEGRWGDAREALSHFTRTSSSRGEDADELHRDLDEES